MDKKTYQILIQCLSPLRGLGLRRFRFVNLVLAFLKPRHAIINGQWMYLDPQDSSSSPHIMSGSFEPFEADIFSKITRSGDTILDIGANVGYYTLLFARLAGNTGKVYAFEPARRSMRILEKNIRSHKYTNVVLNELALSDHNGEGYLFLGDYNHGDNKIYPTNKRERTTIKLAKLDDVIAPRTPVNVIKMDIQGSEVLALRGMKRLLSDNQNLILVSECWPRAMRDAGTSIDEFFDTLEISGFFWRVIDEDAKHITTMSRDEFKKAFPEDGERATNLLCWKGIKPEGIQL